MKLLLIFVLISCCIAQADALTYVMTDLGTMGGASSGAYDINDNGDVLGIVNEADVMIHPGHYNICLYQNGTVTYVDQYWSYAWPYRMNNKGQAVGCIEEPSHQAVLWENGGRTLIFGNDRYVSSSSAYDINDNGQIVGLVSYNQPGMGGGAYLWENGKTTLICDGWAYDINNNGVIVGQRMAHYSGTKVPYIWKDGVLTDLVSSDGTPIYPVEINDLDQVLGYCNGRAVIWDNGVLTDLATLYSVDSIIFTGTNDCFNNRGQIIGTASANGGSFRFVSSGTTLIELATQETFVVRGLNNNGQVVGEFDFPDGHWHAVRWDPVVPEPTSLLALFTGIGILGLARLRVRR